MRTADVPDLPVERAGLRELVALRRTLDAIEVELVCTARLHGESWTTIAEDLELSRQGARYRHLAADPIAARRRNFEAPETMSR